MTSLSKDAQKAHSILIYLARLTTKFSTIHRTTLYHDGHPESDVEHRFHLALSATELAVQFHPELNSGLVSQFSTVHDLVEIYAGDTPSFKLTDEEILKKARIEKVALEKLLNELPVYTAELLKRYEAQQEPEARFVRLIDKLLPPIIHTVAAEANHKPFFDIFDIQSVEDLEVGNANVLQRLKKQFPEFELILLVRELTAQVSTETFAKLQN
ncbi:MAG: HD domain-containing protein [Candidatus Microsaccharimonas sp.]